MRAREIELWLAKILRHGAMELADAEVAHHVVRVWQLVEAMNQRMRPRDAREELLGWDDRTGEIHASMALLRARAKASERASFALAAVPAEAS